MTKRKPIREYLDDPSLLRQLSLDDLENWANEVSYPSIIYQLMAMKVVQEEPSDSNKSVIRNALAFSSNPNKLSRDLYEIALTYEQDKGDTDEGKNEDVPEISVSPETKSAEVPPIQNDLAIGQPETEGEVVEEQIIEQTEIEDSTAEDESLTSFSEWLLSLEQRRVEVAEVSQDEGIISEALAALLAKQGHNERALAMYERLTLKYPQKSTYFAAQIENLRGS